MTLEYIYVSKHSATLFQLQYHWLLSFCLNLSIIFTFNFEKFSITSQIKFCFQFSK